MPPIRVRDVDDVIRAAPSDFVRTRNIVARRLRAPAVATRWPRSRGSGDPPSLWAVNQLAHAHAGELGAFLTAVDQLRTVQLGRGGDDAKRGRDPDIAVNRAGGERERAPRAARARRPRAPARSRAGCGCPS